MRNTVERKKNSCTIPILCSPPVAGARAAVSGPIRMLTGGGIVWPQTKLVSYPTKETGCSCVRTRIPYLEDKKVKKLSHEKVQSMYIKVTKMGKWSVIFL